MMYDLFLLIIFLCIFLCVLFVENKNTKYECKGLTYQTLKFLMGKKNVKKTYDKDRYFTIESAGWTMMKDACLLSNYIGN